jgi:hypothetical protein
MPLLGQSPMSAAIENMAAKTELGMFRAKASPAATLFMLHLCAFRDRR